MRLKVKMIRVENVLIAKILEQDDDLRDRDIIKDGAGYEINSACSPQLVGYEFYVRGSSLKEDNKVICYEYDTIEEAIKASVHFKKLIDLINNDKTDEFNWNIEKIL